MQDVTTTSKTIASARRPDIFIASPRSRSDGQYRLFQAISAAAGNAAAYSRCLPDFRFAIPHFPARKSTENTEYGSPCDLSSKPKVAHLKSRSLQLQSLPDYFPPWKVPTSHTEDLGVARLDLLALRLH